VSGEYGTGDSIDVLSGRGQGTLCSILMPLARVGWDAGAMGPVAQG